MPQIKNAPEELENTLSALKLSFPPVYFCTASDHIFSLLLDFKICCNIHDICFVLRPEQLERRGPRFHTPPPSLLPSSLFLGGPITPDNNTGIWKIRVHQNDL